MKAIRKLLVKLLGIKGYLKLISSIYLKMIVLGFFKKKYAELHFIQKIIQPHDVVIDIGANLGYYSFFMAKSIHKNGALFAIEPIPLFADVWKKNMRKYQANKNIKLFNVALGDEAKAAVKMSIPIVHGIVRHGLTKIDNHNVDQAALSFEVPMYIGEQLLKAEKVNDRATGDSSSKCHRAFYSKINDKRITKHAYSLLIYQTPPSDKNGGNSSATVSEHIVCLTKDTF